MEQRRWILVIWPAFLAAGIMEMLVFAAFDPHDMYWLGQGLELSRNTIYSLCFFAFWAVFILAGYLTLMLTLSSAALNDAPSTAVGQTSTVHQVPAASVWNESLHACFPNT